MIRDTVIIASKEHMQENINQLAKVFSEECKKGINTYINSIEKTKRIKQDGTVVIRITVEFSDDLSI